MKAPFLLLWIFALSSLVLGVTCSGRGAPQMVKTFKVNINSYWRNTNENKNYFGMHRVQAEKL